MLAQGVENVVNVISTGTCSPLLLLVANVKYVWCVCVCIHACIDHSNNHVIKSESTMVHL